MPVEKSLNAALIVLALTLVGAPACAPADDPSGGKIPVTTSSEEARDLFLQARDLQDNIRLTDAHALYEQAIAADPDFALGYVGLANTAPSTLDFVDAVRSAAARMDGASDGERLMIQALEAGLASDIEAQTGHLTELVQLHPNDERAHALLGNLYFGRQDYAAAITHYGHAVDINPDFAPVYNVMGYAQRFQGDLAGAETSFQKYIELIPDDPNPHDSYAELLLKMGRFDESIEHYEQAMAIDPNWINGLVGIGNNQMLQGQFDEARATFGRIETLARNTAERRTGQFWIAASYVHQDATDEAIAAIQANQALSEDDGDTATVAGDHALIGNILREAGRLDEALASYERAVETMNGGENVPDQFKANAARNLLFQQGRVAVARGDLDTARARSTAYAEQVAALNLPGEIRQQHELAGRIALAAEDYAAALGELAQANQQDPVVLYLTALAHAGAGDMDQARQIAASVVDFNELNFNLGYVRTAARQMSEM